VPTCVNVRDAVKFAGEIRRRQAVEALEDEYCKLVVDSLGKTQSVQFTQKWCHVIEFP
jgi:hypothetical protein